MLFITMLAIVAGDPASAVDFNRDVRPILSDACYRCHGPDAAKRKGVGVALRLDTEAGATADIGGYSAIVRGKPDESELIARITSTEADVMPPASVERKLSKAEIQTLTRWVEQGAPYAKHWSYVKPARPDLPSVRNVKWPRNAVDRFVLARLESEGLAPSPEADRASLIRRATLDLTGLPPTLAEVDAFLADPSGDAYEKIVDRLLASPAYGEHWGRLWLDLARYADSAGYADDPPRTIWAYRDWVVRALDANMPFDQFTVEQIAGDLLPNPTDDELTATAFHRNTQTNNEGGTSDEEFRNVAVVDRVNTTMSVWMGTTLMCAQCHDHKYDPLTQKEYFQVFAVFNNTADADRTDEAPVLALYSDAKKASEAEWRAEIAAIEATDGERIALRTESRSPELDPIAERLVDLKSKLASLKPDTTVPIMRELAPPNRRATHIQRRGSFLDVGEAVSEGVPEAFPPLPDGVSKDRLALARWLVADDNPLTARVVANRYWEQLFGVGIVATSEDFGAQGDLPSHSDLLDWMATELVRSHWDMKAFLRLLATSATYRQSSRVSEEMAASDPDNRLLARGPRLRLSAEAIRDQALAASGLLSSKMGGPPVRPPQPSSGLSAAFGGKIDWEPSTGEDRYRRGLYTTWRRSNPYPSMTTFDAPNREFCTLKRTRTNTPLQALVTLNDPAFVEAAQALARRMTEAGPNPSDVVAHGFRLALARSPTPEEVARLVELQAATRAKLGEAKADAEKLATDPLGPLPQGADAADLAAWTVVANVLLNLDETLMKP